MRSHDSGSFRAAVALPLSYRVLDAGQQCSRVTQMTPGDATVSAVGGGFKIRGVEGVVAPRLSWLRRGRRGNEHPWCADRVGTDIFDQLLHGQPHV